MEKKYRLRPHHGLCLPFFRGKGYSGAFVENMTAVKTAMEENPLIELVRGGDHICAACPNFTQGKCRDEEKVTRYDREVLRLCGLEPGQSMPYRDFVRRVREAILRKGLRETVCGDCQWTALCREEETP